MIDIQLYLAFVLAASVLVLIPGPNVALIVANSIAHGTRYGLLTMAGTSSAMIVQLTLTSLGMSAMLGALVIWFEWIRWIGVAYLVYLGVMQWRTHPSDPAEASPQRKSVGAIYARGFLVSLTNPKTLLFYGAFLPQFITLNKDIAAQVILLSTTFVLLAVALDGAWAILAGRARGILTRWGRLQNRLSGGLLIGAGVGLALARKR